MHSLRITELLEERSQRRQKHESISLNLQGHRVGPNFLNFKLISENTICIVRASYPEACIWTFWQGCRADLPCERGAREVRFA